MLDRKIENVLRMLMLAYEPASPCTVESHEKAKLAGELEVIGETEGGTWLQCPDCGSTVMWRNEKRGRSYPRLRVA